MSSFWGAAYSDKKYEKKDLKIKIQIPAAAIDAVYDATKAKDGDWVGCIGIVPVTIWVINPEGKTGRCDTYVDIQNNMGATPKTGNCPALVAAVTCKDTNSKKVTISVSCSYLLDFAFAPFTYSDTAHGAGTPFSLSSNKPEKGVYPAFCVPSNKYLNIKFSTKDDNPLNGISNFDAVLLSKHILGTQKISSKLALIAADVTNNGKITTADVVELRQLILGQIPTFKNNTSWKIFPTYQPAAVLNQSYSYKITKDSALSFMLVKIGDINENACPGIGPRSSQTHYFDLENKALQSGETYRLVLDNQQLDGFQAALKYDTEALELLQTDAFSKASADGIIKTAQLRGERTELVFQVKKDIFLSDAIGLEETALAAEAYENNEIKNLVLRFAQPKVAALKLFQNYPNPTTGVTTIQFQAPAVALYQLYLFDNNGKKVQSFDNQAINGLNQLEVSLSQNGFYTYQIIYQGEVLVGKVVVLK